MRPWRRATLMAAMRSATVSFVKMFLTWTCAVCSLTPSAAAISLGHRPDTSGRQVPALVPGFDAVVEGLFDRISRACRRREERDKKAERYPESHVWIGADPGAKTAVFAYLTPGIARTGPAYVNRCARRSGRVDPYSSGRTTR